MLAVLLLSAASVRASTAQPNAQASSAFCQTSVVHNYAMPLEQLPALRGLPTEQELPFGPRHLLLHGVGWRPLVIKSEELGFRLSHGRAAGGVARPHLKWLVTPTLARVNQQGRAVQTLGQITKPVFGLGSPGGRSFTFQFAFEPGLYRLEIVFENGAGRRLGRFGEYFRAIRPTAQKARLTLNGPSFLPNEMVTARAEEYGVSWLSLHDTYSIEVYDGSNWTRAPISPKQHSLLIGPVVGPGEATSASCWSFQIPSDAAPGLYRFVVEGSSLEPTNSIGLVRGSPRTLTSEFQILPPLG
jgi:hypothetical protein